MGWNEELPEYLTTATKWQNLWIRIEEIRGSWGWFLALGILLTILGIACVAFDVTATFATVLVFGWLLFIGGIFAFVQAFFTGTWSGFFLYLLTALFRGVTGYLLIRYPLIGAESLTLVLASFLIVGGLFRAIGFAIAKFPHWGWAVFSGVVSVALGGHATCSDPGFRHLVHRVRHRCWPHLWWCSGDRFRNRDTRRFAHSDDFQSRINIKQKENIKWKRC
jgi:uncharacterized membrane protein HdeD (DUF308 family)